MFLGGLREVFAKQIPACEDDVRVFRQPVDGKFCERQAFVTDQAFFEQFDTRGHRRPDRAANTHDCNT